MDERGVGMKMRHLRDYVIRPTLKRLGLYSEAAEILLLGTAAHESMGATCLRQVGGGPALGIYQIEPATHNDVWANYLRYKSGLMIQMQDFIPPGSRDRAAGGWVCGKQNLLITDLAYATAIARIIYRRRPERLPDADDLPGIAQYWKDHYNTSAGKGTVEKFLADYDKYCGVELA